MERLFNMNRYRPIGEPQKQKRPAQRAHSKCVAEWTGLEPATPGVTGRYSNQLNYHSAWPVASSSCEPQAPPQLGVP